ncbi:MAG: DMT family transporter [Candidatus Norongarragalinales archaeon]
MLKIKKVELTRGALRDGAIVGFFTFAAYGAQAFGLKFTSATNSAFITGLFLLFAPVCAFVFLRKKFSAAQLLPAALALAGLYLLSFSLDSLNAGDALTLACAVLFGFQVALNQEYSRRNEVFALLFGNLATVAALSLASALVLGNTLLPPMTLKTVLQVAYLAFFGSLFGYFAMTAAQRELPLMLVVLILSCEPFAAALMAIAFGETITAFQWLGGVLMVAAAFLSQKIELNAENQGARG